MKSLKKLIFNFGFVLLFGQSLHAASCCGGGFAVPSIITSDAKAQMTTTMSYSQIDTDVYSNGIWQKKNSLDSTQLYKIEASHIFADRFQVGASLPMQIRTRDGQDMGGTSSGLADVSAQLGYEYLPDWNYNPWRPKGVGFISLTLPTGKSVYESEDGLDSHGRGFFALGIGTILTKAWLKWDASATLEIHRSFDKVISNSQMLGNVQPGFGNSFSLGGGYNIGDSRLGTSIAWVNEDAINVDGTNPSKGDAQQYATGAVSFSQMYDNLWAATLSYSDQTLFGDPTNTSLSKSLSLSIQKRWSR